MKEFFTKVVGVTDTNEDGSSRQELIAHRLQVGHMLHLVPRPDNPHDPGAVAVMFSYRRWFRERQGQIGWLNAELAEQITTHIDQGGHAYAQVKEITGGTLRHPTYGVNIIMHVSE